MDKLTKSAIGQVIRYLMVSAISVMLGMISLEAQTDELKQDLKGKIVDRLETSAVVLGEVMDTPESAIPQNLLDSAVCVGIIPAVKKGAFVVGAAYGRGVMECRQAGNGPWGPPLMIGMHAGSYGFQWGVTATDLIFVVRNAGGARDLLRSKGVLGADASVAAGPVGRTVQAQTDLRLNAQILTYSRSRGLFVGVSLKGAAVKPDSEANMVLYGRLIDPPKFVFQRGQAVPKEAKPLLAALHRYSPRGGAPLASLAIPRR